MILPVAMIRPAGTRVIGQQPDVPREARGTAIPDAPRQHFRRGTRAGRLLPLCLLGNAERKSEMSGGTPKVLDPHRAAE